MKKEREKFLSFHHKENTHTHTIIVIIFDETSLNQQDKTRIFWEKKNINEWRSSDE